MYGDFDYDLIAKAATDNIALVRVEQLYPFPETQVKEVLDHCLTLAEIVWAQEEPRNMGPWRVMREYFDAALEPTRRQIRYVGRPESASSATGSGKRHQQEQSELVTDALTPGAISQTRKVRVVSRRKK